LISKKEAELIELALQKSEIETKADKDGIKRVPDIRTFYPTEEEF
jgi:hypothetical protein